MGMEASHKNAGMNYPPQATNSSIMSTRCLMKTHIEENNLDHKVKVATFCARSASV
jgi:hypothetical protein